MNEILERVLAAVEQQRAETPTIKVQDVCKSISVSYLQYSRAVKAAVEAGDADMIARYKEVFGKLPRGTGGAAAVDQVEAEEEEGDFLDSAYAIARDLLRFTAADQKKILAAVALLCHQDVPVEA